MDKLSTAHIGPMGFCIYCGAKAYKPGSDERLTDEHIVAEGLAGAQKIKEASCHSCQTIIHKFETAMMRGPLLPLRAFYNFPSKNKNRPDVHREFHGTDDDQRLTYPLDPLTTFITLPLYGGSAFLVSEAGHIIPDLRMLNLHISRKEGNIDKIGECLAKGIPSDEFSTFRVYFNHAYFCRMLAKIAHCVTVAALGVSGFRPVLNNFILGREDDRWPFYVGSSDHAVDSKPEDTHPHRIERGVLLWRSSIPLYYVKVRLFQTLPLPEYIVYTGDPI